MTTKPRCEGTCPWKCRTFTDIECDCPCHSPLNARKEVCTALTDHENWCDCGRPECWEEQLRLRVGFDKNQDREVCILFIHRLLKETTTELLEGIERKVITYTPTKPTNTYAKGVDFAFRLAADIIRSHLPTKKV